MEKIIERSISVNPNFPVRPYKDHDDHNDYNDHNNHNDHHGSGWGQGVGKQHKKRSMLGELFDF